MIKQKVSKIINSLIKFTSDGSIKWTEINPQSRKRYFERSYKTYGEDSTEYTMDIRWVLIGDGWQIDSSPTLFIKNDSLPNGAYYAYDQSLDLKGLRNAIIDTHCQDMKPQSKDVEDIFDEIYNNINISANRDDKIEKVFE
jgi:hypothetical protein